MKYLILKPVITQIIESVVKKTNNIKEFDIDWDETYYQLLFYNPPKKCTGILVDNYPKNDEILEIYIENMKKVKVTQLVVYNISGWNTDPRCRGISFDDERYDIESKNQTGLEDYKDIITINKTNITLQDIAEAVFEVKSGKKDYWYELFADCETEIKILNNNDVELELTLRFDHGS